MNAFIVDRCESSDSVRAGDRRHGAARDSAMTHIAIQEALDGKVVDWMEKVTDVEYARAG
jgi:hypothetical protein